MDLNATSAQIVDAAMKVHSKLGPGVFESAYEVCLAFELRRRGLEVHQQVPQPIHYYETTIDVGYKLDMLVNGSVVVELKTVKKLQPVHDAQLLSYLKLGGFKLGLLINFHEHHLKDGIKRMVN
jgi:GxxExxY protein